MVSELGSDPAVKSDLGTTLMNGFTQVGIAICIALAIFACAKRKRNNEMKNYNHDDVTTDSAARTQEWAPTSESDAHKQFKKTKRRSQQDIDTVPQSLPMMVNPLVPTGFGDQWSFTKKNPIRDPSSMESMASDDSYAAYRHTKRIHKPISADPASQESDLSSGSYGFRPTKRRPPSSGSAQASEINMSLSDSSDVHKNLENLAESETDTISPDVAYIEPISTKAETPNPVAETSEAVSAREAQEFLAGVGGYARDSAAVSPHEMEEYLGDRFNKYVEATGMEVTPDNTPMGGPYVDAKKAKIPQNSYVNVEDRLAAGEQFDRAAKQSLAGLGYVEAEPAAEAPVALSNQNNEGPSSPADSVYNTFTMAKTMGRKEFLEMLFYKSRPGSGRKLFVRTPSNRREELVSCVKTAARELETANIKRGRVVGEGSFGYVYKGTLLESGYEIPVAIKELKPDIGERAKIHFLQEAYLLAQLNHPNIIAYIGGIVRIEPHCIVMELCKESLLNRVRMVEHTLLEKIKMCLDIARGCGYLYDAKFVHRDLAARNILVDDETRCKIADFGLACPLANDKDYYKSSGGKIPLRWCAPECINFRKYSAASDVWAFGVIMFEVFSDGEVPYGGVPNHILAREVTKGRRLKAPLGCPQRIYNLALKCWDADPGSRVVFPIIQAELESIMAEGDLDPVARNNSIAKRTVAPSATEDPYEMPVDTNSIPADPSEEFDDPFTEEELVQRAAPAPPVPERDAPPPPLRRRAPLEQSR